MSQRELANRAGISEGYVPQLETGKSRPDVPVLRRIATVLEADYEELAALAGYIDAPSGEIVVYAEPAKARALRRLSHWSADQLLALERMARIAFLEGMPPAGEPGRRAAEERSQYDAHDEPDAETNAPAGR